MPLEFNMSSSKRASDLELQRLELRASLEEGTDHLDEGPEAASKRRKEWNRMNARKARQRRKIELDGLIATVERTEKENSIILDMIASLGLTKQWEECLRKLARSDQALLSSVTSAQTHFIITDPTLPDNPIVFASSGFYALSGYTPQEILGHNCRFMQGQHTNPATVKRLSAAIAAGQDCRCVILNYSKAGVPFWNDLFCAALRDDGGNIVHFVGVQSNIAEARAKVMLQLLAETDGVITSDASHAHEKGTKAATCDPAVAASPGHLP